MGKKGIKRKTQWRTLSITECPPQNLKSALAKQHLTDKNNVNATNTTETNNNEVGAISQDDDCSIHESSYSNHTYLKRKTSTSSTYRNDYRNSSRYSYNSKHNSASSTSSLHSSSRYTAYRRRPFSSLQNGSSRYTSYGSERTYSRGHRSTFLASNQDADDPTKKLPFNEDDYTRISTPRQDVIFKKGCFSQPKKYVSSTDTNTTSSAAASIVSAEESVSALSLPSLSPEQCSSVADSLDPDQGFVYSFIDQNGVVYSYVPNGFDQYNGQMMMLPYGYPPYMCSPDVTSPTGSSEDNKQSQLPSESEETPSSDLNETKVIDEVPMDASNSTTASSEETLNMQDNNDNKDNEEKDEKEDKEMKEVNEEKEKIETVTETVEKVDEINEELKENKENSDNAQNIPGQFYNYGYPTYYPPPILYPYMVPQQFVPVFGNEFDIPVEEEYNEEIEDQNRIRYRCRKKRRNTEGNSTGVSAATTDYSEEESDQETSVAENGETRINVAPSDAQDVKNPSTQPHETDQKLPALNANVKEFVPRRITQSSLNADVQEFLPRTSKDSVSDIQFGDVPKGALFKYNKESYSTRRTPRTTESTRTANTFKIQVQSGEKPNEKRRSELTLAEKIKNSLAAEASSVGKKTETIQKVFPQRRNGKVPLLGKGSNITIKNNRTRTKVERVVKQSQQTLEIQPSQPSYAQIANHGKVDVKKIALNEKDMHAKDSSSLEPKTKSTAEIMNETKSAAPTNSSLASSLSDPITVDTWQTVKPRGKRGKNTKDTALDESHIENYLPAAGPEPEKVVVMSIASPKLHKTPDPPRMADVPDEKPAPSTEAVSADSSAETESETKQLPAVKKTPKSKNRKNSRKTMDLSAKKKNKLQLLEPVFELPKTEKPTSKKNTEPSFKAALSNKLEKLDIEADADTIESSEVEEEEEAAYIPNGSKFSFDPFSLGKGFGRNPMDILKGFDYKYTTKSILKEEEDMVLSVIKSLNNSSSVSPPKLSPETSMVDDDESDEKTIEEDHKSDVQDSESEEDTLSELSLVGNYQNESQLKDGIEEVDETEIHTEGKILAEIEEDILEHSSSADTNFCIEVAEKQSELMEENKSNSHETISETTNSADEESIQVGSQLISNGVKFTERFTDEPVVPDQEERDNHVQEVNERDLPCLKDDHHLNANFKSDEIEQLNVEDEKQQSCSLNGTEESGYATENCEKITRKDEEICRKIVNGDYLLSTQPKNRKMSQKDVVCKSLTTDENHEDPFNNSELLVACAKTEELELSRKTVYGASNDGKTTVCMDPTQIVCDGKPKPEKGCNENRDKIAIVHPECNGKLTNGIGATEFKNISEEEFIGKLQNSDFIHNMSNNQNGILEKSEKNHNKFLEETLTSDKGVSMEYNLNGSYPTTKNSTTNSPLKLNEKLLEDLSVISVPKISEHVENEDYISCVNALKAIIRSRECSLEPERSLDSSEESNSLNGLKESEVSGRRSPDLEISIDTEVKNNNSCAISLEEATSSEECTTNQSIYTNKERIICPSQKDKALTELSDVGTNGLQTTLNRDASSLKNEEVASFKALPVQESVQQKISKELNETNLNFSETVLTEQCLESFNDAEKVSCRVLNTSISCDHSSGIGSDCEDNQPTSPRATEDKNQPRLMADSNCIAQISKSPEVKPLFPINATVLEDTHLPEVKHMPINVLPIYSQTNSVSCDNQFVSYTSSDSCFDGNLNPRLESTITSVDHSKDNHLLLDATPKFPSHNESLANGFPLTEAVKQWLVEESKEPSPEPLFRIPEDAALKVLFERQQNSAVLADKDEWTSTDGSDDEHDYGDNEYEEDEADYLQKRRTNPKNLKGNPLRVSSCNATTVDSDSDYNSDANDPHCTGRNDDNTGKRVAATLSDKSANVLDKNDLLEYWDDEFVSNPAKWLRPGEVVHTTNQAERDDNDRKTRSPSTDLEPYRSLYGKTIDYNQLKANNYESLSNNILSISKNDANKAKTTSSHNNRAATEHANQSQRPLGSNKFYNNNAILRNISTTNMTSTPAAATTATPPLHENCMKPPEVCCLLM